jgi:RNA polymerase sigma factor (sigma-70 family)
MNIELIIYEDNISMDNARDIVMQNQGLIKKIAWSYAANGNYEIEDLIQEGNLGLIKALDKYDSSKGTKFSTYAVFWINNYITRYVKKNKKDTISPDEPIDNDKEITRLETIKDTSCCIEESVCDKLFKKNIRQLIDETLCLEEQEVIKMKYGFYLNCLGFDEIGIIIGKNRQAAKRINDKALSKLRRTKLIHVLRIERNINKNVENYSRKIINPEIATVKMSNELGIELKNIDNHCIGNEPFYKWYRSLLTKLRKLLNTVEKITRVTI